MKQYKRLLAQFGFFLLQNPFLGNFVSGQIYRGELKRICTPGLNCYSCPAATVSCPMGAAQLFFSGVRHSIGLYITGFLLTLGVIFGRFICGFVCPMGLLQDLLYRIRTPKIMLRLRFLRYMKYVVLLLFIIILPMVIRHELSGLGYPWFCAYICPSGTLLGAIPLLAANEFLREFLGTQFILKIIIAGSIVVLSVFIFRIFCRVLCPLGAIYALLNRFAILHMECNKHTCTTCGDCSKTCPVMIEPMNHPNASECFRCGRCVNSCPQKALSYTMRRQGIKLFNEEGNFDKNSNE
jgi:polyferredoxin